MELKSQQDLVELKQVIEERCTPIQQEILKRHFGIAPYHQHTLQELARAFHMCPSHMRRRMQEAIDNNINLFRTCPSCYQPFRPVRNQVCCSYVCQRKHYFFKKSEKLHKKRRKQFGNRTCRWCDAPLEPKSTKISLSKVYCNAACAGHYRRFGKNLRELEEEFSQKACVRCGKPLRFLPNVGSKQKKYCSFECAELSHVQSKSRERTPEELNRKCVGCGKSIGSKKLRAHMIYCTVECRANHVSRLQKQVRLESKQDRVCQYCGVPLSPEKRQGTKFCSAECGQQMQNQKRRKPRDI